MYFDMFSVRECVRIVLRGPKNDYVWCSTGQIIGFLFSSTEMAAISLKYFEITAILIKEQPCRRIEGVLGQAPQTSTRLLFFLITWIRQLSMCVCCGRDNWMEKSPQIQIFLMFIYRYKDNVSEIIQWHILSITLLLCIGIKMTNIDLFM